jgi:phosphatidylserine decarboxylase
LSFRSLLAAQAIRALPRVPLSNAVGALAESHAPRPLVRAVMNVYCRAYDVDLSEAAPVEGGYPSFDEFFTRRLAPGVRPIDDGPVVCPADGVIASAGPIDGSTLSVKSQQYSVAELTGEPSDAERYAGGTFAVIYLSPRDYHRVHSPVDGHVVFARGIGGDLFPVNAIGERYVPGLFVKNQRVSIVIDTPTLGRVTAVMVGATIVGRITVSCLDRDRVTPGLHTPATPVAVRRGDEIGIFHLGSTVVLLLEPCVRTSPNLGRVRYGSALSPR